MAPFGNAHQKGGGQGKLMGKSSVCGYWVNIQTMSCGAKYPFLRSSHVRLSSQLTSLFRIIFNIIFKGIKVIQFFIQP